MINREQINDIQVRIQEMGQAITNEQITRQSLIMPFFTALGYDVYNPTVFVPEYTADFGTKQGEKADFAVLDKNKPVMLIEAKKLGTTLDTSKASQLGRYFGVTTAKLGILTDGRGRIYKFHSDLERRNIMDLYPFYEFDILELDEKDLEHLEHYTAANFAFDRALQAGLEIKRLQTLRDFFWQLLTGETVDPEFIRFVLKQTGLETHLTSAKIDRYTPLVINSMLSVVNDIDADPDFSVALLEGEPAPEKPMDIAPEEQSTAKRNARVPDIDRNLYAALALKEVYTGRTLSEAGRKLFEHFPEVFKEDDGAKVTPATRHGTNAGIIITGRSWRKVTGFDNAVTKYTDRPKSDIREALDQIVPLLTETELLILGEIPETIEIAV